MPQTPDPVADILRRAPVPDPIRAQAWDAYEAASDPEALTKALQAMPLPQQVKADLWDLKSKAGSTPPPAIAAPQAPGRSLASKAADWLPMAGGMVGGFVGGIPGAAVGGAAGEGLRTTAQHLTELPGAIADVATNVVAHPRETLGGFAEGALGGLKDAAVQAGIQGGAQAVGQGFMGAAKWGGEKLMQSAVKPAYKTVEKAIKANELPRVVKTLLDEGINVTTGGIGKINTLLAATNKQIDDIISTSARTVSPTEVVKTARTAVQQASQQVAPSSDVQAARKVISDFIARHGRTATGDIKPIPVQRAQQLKQGTYKALSQRAYGETKGAAVEAEKQLARGLKEGIERQLPEVRGLNRRAGGLIEAQDAVARRVGVAGNRDPGGLAPLAPSPEGVVAFLMSRSPAIKSLIARGLYQSAARAAGVTENFLRAAITAVATSEDDR